MKNFIRRPRREPLSLQLTAMIDVFSMIVIFLVVGASHEHSDIIFPNGFVLPKSKSKEDHASSNEVIVSTEKVSFKKLNLELGIKEFSELDSEASTLRDFEKSLHDYVRSRDSKEVAQPLSLNIIADERVEYERLYSILKVFRKAGFQNIYFVASPKGAKS